MTVCRKLVYSRGALNFLTLRGAHSLAIYSFLLDYVVVILQFGEGMTQMDLGMTLTDPSVFYHIFLFCFYILRDVRYLAQNHTCYKEA